MWWVPFLVLQAGVVSTPPNVMPPHAEEVVVVWEGRVELSQERLRTCLARNCVPVEDVTASLALADAQFVNGLYDEARRTLHEARRRLQRAPGEHPRLRASLLNGTATVAEHQGDLFDAMYARGGAARALWSAGPDTIVPALNARIASALMQARLGRISEARTTLRLTAGMAVNANQPLLAQAVRMYDAAIQWRSGAQRPAERTLRDVMVLEGDGFRSLRVASAALLTQLLNESGREDRTGLLEQVVHREQSGAKPVLLYSPPLERLGPVQGDAFGFIPDRTITSESIAVGGWMDLGYWVRPDGSVAEVQVLRGARHAGLTDYIRDIAARRRYAATPRSASPQGWYEIRRFSIGYERFTPLGSRIIRRAGAPMIAEMDLAVVPAAAERRETS